eukprot:CAMPEP_0206259796 /NCGR_PEP_ID=MMETSP0047_2-20121206/26697_1 /ASSEMBLY_ACC=CAM_ASM_000192 /TAXON_ID=195065 /ORGANISM="Chroomonas mesostigmatica_cf, Strain CCMP1168" /LENGTH=147 /DNA_ID=CAMNT_0053686737 /DNA_START=14 /DNA_END=454 /DNA_ORIENTATION=-
MPLQDEGASALSWVCDKAWAILPNIGVETDPHPVLKKSHQNSLEAPVCLAAPQTHVDVRSRCLSIRRLSKALNTHCAISNHRLPQLLHLRFLRNHNHGILKIHVVCSDVDPQPIRKLQGLAQRPDKGFPLKHFRSAADLSLYHKQAW